MSAITAKASRKMKKYAVLTREPRCFLGSFDFSWEQRKLGELSSLITKGTTPLDKSNMGTVNFVKIESIDNSSGEITITQKITSEEHEGYLRRSQLKENDILFSIAGTLGRVTSVKSSILPANTNQALAIIRLKSGCLKYVKTYLKGKAVADFIKKNPTIGAQPNLSLEQVSNLEIALPSDIEQEQIGSFFENLDNLITLHQRKCALLFSPFQALISMMFTTSTFSWEQRKFEEIAVRSSVICSDDTLPRVEYFSINTPKTKAGEREIPMTEGVKQAFLMEREFQSQAEISSKSRVDGYDDFIFVNRYGDVQNQGNLNKALRRMMRDCNDEILEKYGADSDPVLLPQFSCHILRHTFATRLCESGANLKFIQSILGHADVSTTMNIYVDVTDALKKKEITAFDDYMTTKLET